MNCDLQDISGTACSDMCGLRSSSDLLSDSVSPCNLETTHNINLHLSACLETERQITTASIALR